ncbi:hypothetical protein B0A48_10436 [Cryoendolithus antarcticus]|uniref:Rad4 beta-hairpin domain-containing protein n=1 Tax=Cryoendolithus antarcticus TaxID=1507870 RepID=A0A1V8SXA5_9PEZI|nr:hypothetical protein B0A48_10436 [Cryoendolithus antarcticus]
MAPSRGKARRAQPGGPSTSSPATTSRGNRRRGAPPSVYGELADEVAQTAEPERPLKRRRILREVSIPKYRGDDLEVGSAGARKSSQAGKTIQTDDRARTGPDSSSSRAPPLQTVDASSDSDDSGFAFEDVNLAGNAVKQPGSDSEDEKIADLAISVGPSSTSKTTPGRRKAASAPEKAFRLTVHKAHFLTLLGHCVFANSRCNDVIVQKQLRKLVDKKTRSYLNPDSDFSQFQRNRSLMDGLEMAANTFRAHFQLTTSGMRSAVWKADSDVEVPPGDTPISDVHEFRLAAKDMQGSQDTGNQLFCALLRSIGVEARLVCSLQVLPYASVAVKLPTPQKYRKPVIFAIASDTDPTISDASASDNNIGSSRGIGSIPSVRRRLGQNGLAGPSIPKPRPKERKAPVRKLAYPVYWVEAFDAAYQKWVAVDAVVTETVGKPTKIEPPIAYALNSLNYVIAFEADGVARDVTRRYAKAFNAKTRRQRVESSEGGTAWLKKALRHFRRRDAKLDRDQVEDSELAAKEAREGLPGNVLDFKDHPYYALERHLRRHEVLHPRREVGKVNAGTAAKPRMEAVFRRQDVLSCKSADKWYRLGREIKVGEQPLKHIPAHGTRRRGGSDSEQSDAEGKRTALYSAQQTQLYIPPPVTNGRVPRNAFGNLDIYVPSMVPGGGTHIQHSLTQQAARIMQVDYADAVTGFKFQGRHGTAVIEGAVVAEEYAEALHAVIEGLEYEATEEESRDRSILALRMWARMLKGLRIAERVASYGRGDDAEEVRRELDEVEDEGAAGGFVLADGEETAMPTAGKFSLVELAERRKAPKNGKQRMEVESEENEEEYTPVATRSLRRRKAVVRDDESEDEADGQVEEFDGGGGFLPDDADKTIDDADVQDLGGGFLPEGDNDDDGGGGFVRDDAIRVGETAYSETAGGEFMVQNDDNDDGGGGFLVDEEDMQHSEIGSLAAAPLQQPSNTDHRDYKDPPPSDHTEEELPASQMDESLPDATSASTGHHIPMDITPVSDAPPAAVSTEKPGVTSTKANRDHQMTEPSDATHADTVSDTAHMLNPISATEEANAEVTDEDRGSLMSHDPEDEDAEPDWMESD